MGNDRILFNTRVRIYPNGSRIVTYSSLPVFSPRFDPEDNDIEDINDLDDTPNSLFDKRRNFEKDNVLRAAVRARQRIFDIGFLNDWSYFCTFTFSDPLPQRDPSVALKVVQNWLKYEVYNYRKDHPNFKYLCVPEYGGRYGNVHLHFLMSDIPVVDSGCVLIKGYDRPVKRCNLREYDVVLNTVYNVPLWNKGFSTAIRIYKNDGALSHYLSKYMTKDQKMIFGKYYWSSQNISREPKMEYYNTPYDVLLEKMLSDDLSYIMLPGTRVRLVYESFVTYSNNS